MDAYIQHLVLVAELQRKLELKDVQRSRDPLVDGVGRGGLLPDTSARMARKTLDSLPRPEQPNDKSQPA
jgi:hypothetical protein